jgi:hypothetical protein
MNPKLLIFSPSPRNDPEFEERMALVLHDKYWMKYHSYDLHPYNKARNFFLNHKEYTHFAICPDDLMITPEGVDKLWQSAQTLKVIMGTCNVEPASTELAMTRNLPSKERGGRIYDFFSETDVNGKIIQVDWCGTPFAIFQRSVIEKLTFDGDRKWNKNKTAFAYDVIIAHDLKAMKIKINVDTSVKFYHKRHVFKVLNDSMNPVWWWDRVGKDRVIDPEFRLRVFEESMEEFKKEGGSGKLSTDKLLYAMYDQLFVTK